MDIITLITTASAAFAAVGGVEAAKFFIGRKEYRRKVDAEADAAAEVAQHRAETEKAAADAEAAAKTESSTLLPQKAAKPPKNKRQKRTSMSFWTALSLSCNNLLTKKTRSLLTSFAGSIGIIGIALILSLSNGIQIYIDRVQEDALSSYPLSIESVTMDMNEMLNAIAGSQNEDV